MYFKQMITIFSYVTGFQGDSIVKTKEDSAKQEEFELILIMWIVQLDSPGFLI